MMTDFWVWMAGASIGLGALFALVAYLGNKAMDVLWENRDE